MEPTTQDQAQNKFLVPLAIIVAGALIAGAIYMGDRTSGTNTGNTRTNPQNVKVEGVRDTDHILGSRSAELTVIEYSDTECPFCKVFHNTMKDVLNQYGDRVAWVYRHLPIEQLHAKAIKEAEATECVAELGGNQAFWKYLDSIFVTTNSNDSLDPAQLPKLAKAIGIDESLFNDCLSSGKYQSAIRDSVEEGYKAGAQGTPYSVIVDKNGKVLEIINGAEPLNMVKTKIDALLK